MLVQSFKWGICMIVVGLQHFSLSQYLLPYFDQYYEIFKQYWIFSLAWNLNILSSHDITKIVDKAAKQLGRFTKKLRCWCGHTIHKVWSKRKYGQVDFYISQLRTGHRCFRADLYRFGLSPYWSSAKNAWNILLVSGVR